MELESTDRYLPDLGISQNDARVLLDQFMSHQISEDDFWWCLGFDFYDRKPKNKTADLFKSGAKVEYLINTKKNKNVAHIWTGNDTACHCYANGSLGNKKNFSVVSTHSRLTCQNCLSNI